MTSGLEEAGGPSGPIGTGNAQGLTNPGLSANTNLTMRSVNNAN
jgi:hypothetical protein